MILLQKIISLARHDIGRLWRSGTFHIGFASWLSRFTQLIQRILLARILGVELLGHIAVINSAMNLIRLPAGAGMFTAAGKLIAEKNGDEDAQRRVIGTALRIASVTSLAAMAGGWLLLAFTPVVKDAVANHYLRLLLAFLPLFIGAEMLRTSLQAQRRMRTVAILDTMTVLGSLVMMVPFVYAWKLPGYVATQIIIVACVVIALVFLLRKVIGFGWHQTKAGPMVRMGAFAFLGQLVGALMLQFDTLYLSSIVQDATITAIYNTAAIVSHQMLAFPGALLTVTFPFVAQHHADLPALRQRYHELFWKMGLAATGLALLAALVAPYFFLVFGSEFTGSVQPFRVLVLGFIARCLYVLDNTFLDGLGRTDLTFYSGFFSALIMVVLNVIAVPRWGMMGAAWATTLAMVSSFFIRQLVVRNVLHRRKYYIK